MVTLFRDNQPVARIVLSPDAEPADCRAAEAMQRVTREMSGAELLIGSEAGKANNIFIGRAAGMGLDCSEGRLGYDGYLIKSSGNHLVLAGRRPYSSLYAVYHFLERYMGCGFFEEGEQIPQKDTFFIADMEDLCVPRFTWRIYFANMQE